MTTLRYNPGSGDVSYTLRSPLLGDEREIKVNAVYRRARSGALYGYVRPPEVQKLNLKFGDMNRPKIQGLVAFMKAALNYPIILVLDNGDTWLGRILNDLVTTHKGHANNTFDLIFEGTLT